MKAYLYAQTKRLFTLVLFVSLFLIAPGQMQAKVKAPTTPVDIAELVKEIERITQLLKERQQFNLFGASIIEGERPDYFSLKVADSSVSQLYGSSEDNLVINTDGGASQIMIESQCEKLDGILRLGNNATCQNQTWLSNYTESNGVRTFVLPISYDTTSESDTLNFKAYACRYNGCIYENTFSVTYKNALTFGDKVKIYDRYEWTYDWANKTHHVQEVLLNFPYKEIRKVKLLVRCEVGGLYLMTDDDFRATCNSRREYTQPDFKDYTTDEQNNTYNLKIESLTKDIQKENVGLVVMNFMFINKHNRVIYETTHRPIQLDSE